MECQKECISVHNKYRLNHGVEMLQFNQTLADQSQAWCDQGVIGHSDWASGIGGECYAWGGIFPSFTSAVKAWHDEEKDYDYNTGEGTCTDVSRVRDSTVCGEGKDDGNQVFFATTF